MDYNRQSALGIEKDSLSSKKYEFIEINNKCEPIGEGGSGIVFLANQIFNKEDSITLPRAIKFFAFRDDLVNQFGYASYDNFKTEIINITQFNHQNILKVIDGDYYDIVINSEQYKIPYTVTEYIDGCTLEDIFSEKHVNECRDFICGEEKLFDIFAQITEGVMYLHSHNFYHCDIAPKNIFIKQNRTNEWFAIIGDIGAGRTLINGSFEKTLVVGTWDYMPNEVKEHKNKIVDWECFNRLQPAWDIYSLIKTIQETIRRAFETGCLKDTWHLERLRDKLNSNKYTKVEDIRADLELLRPSSNKVFGLDELSEASHLVSQVLIPIEPVLFSKPMKKISKHKMLLRLMDVPELLEGAATFPSANHTRYEHSLGTYMMMRKAILALLRNKEYVSFFDDRTVVIGLLAALLSSVVHFPLSYAALELKNHNSESLKDFDNRKLFEKLLNYSSSEEPSIMDLISKYYDRYEITIEELKYVVFGKNSSEIRNDKLEVLHHLLNSSVGVRVIDYMARDSYHIGLTYGIDTDSLFSFLSINKNRFCLKQYGITSAEQIIITRYWLFKRIYWCEPNRANVALLKYLFYIADSDSFSTTLIDEIPTLSRLRIKELMTTSRPENENMINGIFDFIDKRGKDRYKRIAVVGKEYTKANAPEIWQKLIRKRYGEQEIIRLEIQEKLIDFLDIELNDCLGAPALLIDIPYEKQGNKLGGDITVIRHDESEMSLSKASTTIERLNEYFDEQLIFIRIYLRPDLNRKYIEEKKITYAEVEDKIYDWLYEIL